MRELGKRGEDLAAAEYRKSGYRLLQQNFIFPKGKQTGEIDLILVRGRELVFVEVKTRTSDRFGGPLEAVDFRKQARLVKTAKLFLQAHPQYQDYDYRIDVAAVDVDNPDHSVIILPNAIEDLD